MQCSDTDTRPACELHTHKLRRRDSNTDTDGDGAFANTDRNGHCYSNGDCDGAATTYADATASTYTDTTGLSFSV